MNAVPTPSEGYLVIEPDSAANREIIYYTSKGANYVTCPSVAAGRGVGGTSAAAHSSGVAVQMNVVAEHFEALQDGTAFAVGGIGASPYADGWTPILGSTPNTVTYNGNRNYDLVFNGVDHTSTLSPGMKLQLTRTVAAPSQCTDLEASSSQSWSKASATGFSTGTTWTWAAKIKVESYGAGVIGALDDGTNRLQLFLDSSGRINISGGLVAGDDVVTSYASVPLNKWVDVTASITIGTPTGEIRLDDTVIASFVTASASTTMTIGTPTLYAGRNNAGNYFDGKIAQLAVFNAVISDATLKTYSSQTKTGSETSCKGLWKFNGDGNDSSSSANNLTASNGAAATNADSPFANAVTAGLLEYAEVNSVTFSTNTTVNVRVPDTCQIPTSGGVSAVSYSTQSNPYGLPYFSKVLAKQLTNSQSGFTSSASIINGSSTTVYAPANSKLKVTLDIPSCSSSAQAGLNAGIYNSATVTGASVTNSHLFMTTLSTTNNLKAAFIYDAASAGNVSFCASYSASSGTGSVAGGAAAFVTLTVELV